MLSKKLHEAMNAQINAELWSAYLYLSMSMDAEAKGLKGVANWFYVQFQEEQDHARIFMNYILSRDAEVKLLPIEEVRTAWTSPLEMFQDTLVHEKEVTAMIQQSGRHRRRGQGLRFVEHARLVRRRAGRGGGVGTRDDHRLRGRRRQQVRAVHARQGAGPPATYHATAFRPAFGGPAQP